MIHRRLISCFTFLFWLMAFNGYAQKTGGAQTGFTRLSQQTLTRWTGTYSFDLPLSEQVLKEFVKEHMGLSGDWNLVMENRIESPAAYHYHFQLIYKGTPLYHVQVGLNVSRAGKLLTLFTPTGIAGKQPLSTTFPDEQPARLLAAAQMGDVMYDAFTSEHVWVWNNGNLLPSVRVHVRTTDFRVQDFIVDENGELLERYDYNRYVHAPAPPDSLVDAHVFMPDPLTSAGVNYGGNYVDNNDGDSPYLNNERKAVAMKVMLDGDTFRLKGPYAEIKEFSIPDIPPVRSVVPSFDFTRSQDGFEDVNAYYHVNVFQEHVQALGFTNLVNYPIQIDAHALNGDDNSQFVAGTPGRLFFGEGGVDDAEDADVVNHEYGHAISQDAAPNTNWGTERNALDEANGDYFAASWSRYYSPNGWENVFTWDGHNEFWDGRTAVSSKHYPEDVQQNLYLDTDIWSATLMEIWGVVGMDVTDRILLQSMYSYAGNMSMQDAAYLYVEADELLYGGSHYPTLYKYFVARGLLPDTCTSFSGNNVVVNAGSDRTVCPGVEVTIGGSPTAFGNTIADSLRWTPASGLSCTDCSNPVVQTSQTTNYMVTAYWGVCPISDTVTVRITECQGLVSVIGSEAFRRGKNGTRLTWPAGDPIHATLWDVTGKMLDEYTSSSGNLPIDSRHLNQGVYLLQVDWNGERYVFRLAKNWPAN
ncbi:MAG: T9SS type A sorting domain-containing protein [Flavobacteriales bacterium]|nr:T9SS type A sorting domain-containing protein [Flavobacteriales bacterium]